jgi:16S rRNA A1518/A1519 N6-dimethyltransferase RsmA/KsgA/DIM1 with predicted DNA glycosylase/AP lyase activity
LVTYDKGFSQKSTETFARRIKSNDYEYGRKVTEFLNEISGPDFEVLEIGPGPGTLTIPLSPTIKRIIAIERSLRDEIR